MLIERFYSNKPTKKKILYECDMCGKQIHNNENTKLLMLNSETHKEKKLYDLCSTCLKILEKSVTKYRMKKGG